jgi:uncharacterized protein (DUF1778 family)
MPKLSPSRKAGKPPKNQLFEARITRAQKELFERAAGVQGRSPADFVIAAAEAEAMRAIEATTAIQLDAVDSRRLAEALLGPGREPNEKMRAAVKDYLETVR